VSAVGAYNRAWNLGRRFVEGAWRINEMLFPTLVERRAEGDHHGFDRALIDTIRYSALGMLLPAAAGGGAAAGVMAIFGPGFEQASDALAILLLMPALFTVASIQRHALFSVDRPAATTWIAIGRMVATLALSVPLTRSLGAAGTALAVVAGLALETGYMFWTTRRHLAQPLLRLWPVRQVSALVASYAVGFLVARVVDDAVAGLLGTVAALCAGGAAYVAIFLLAGGLGPRDRERWASLQASFRERRRVRRLDPQLEL
jgi:O-antigen/teichoic acid export membrane protein